MREAGRGGDCAVSFDVDGMGDIEFLWGPVEEGDGMGWRNGSAEVVGDE